MLSAHAALLTNNTRCVTCCLDKVAALRRSDAGYSTSARDEKRAWRADADYATSERDVENAARRRGQKKYSNQVLLPAAFL
jgi:hypothetical protein